MRLIASITADFTSTSAKAVFTFVLKNRPYVVGSEERDDTILMLLCTKCISISEMDGGSTKHLRRISWSPPEFDDGSTKHLRRISWSPPEFDDDHSTIH